MALDFERTDERNPREETPPETKEKPKREDESEKLREIRDEKLREMRNSKERYEMPQDTHDRPSYLRTATSSNALNTETVIEAVIGQYECPDNLFNTAKNINSFHDRIAWYKEKYPKSP